MHMVFLLCFLVFSHAASLRGLGEGNQEFLIGTGIFDITGPAAELGMMGYGMVHEKTHGILQRIYARAFIFAEQDIPDQRVVFVITDLGMIFQSVHLEVLKRLKAIYGTLYTEQNVMLNATHSHSGPGGFAHDTLYNLTTFGFDNQNFEAICHGIVQAIVRAHNNLTPANARYNIGQVANASFNRSPAAYELNPAEERALFAENVDRSITQIRIEKDGQARAILNWFAVHGTTLDNQNLLISGDNKGYAAIQFERMQHSSFDEAAFVAGFAQEASGDVSPNEFGAGAHGDEGIEKLSSDGDLQVNAAIQLFHDNQAQALTPKIDYRQTFVDMSNVQIGAQFTEGKGEQHTCPSAIGISMLAGAADGPGYGKQGIRCHRLEDLFERPYEDIEILCNPFFNACHGEKPIAVSTGTTHPPMIPQILPFQIMTIGQLALVGLPFEITTMAGRRIKRLVLELLQPIGVERVIVTAPTNAYAGYVTTKEEYQLQRYEGASNQFGPYSLNAIQQILHGLCISLTTNQPAPQGPSPLDLSHHQVHRALPLIVDRLPFWERIRGKTFGSLKEDVQKTYFESDNVVVEFWGAYPDNNLLWNDSFLFVEKYDGALWHPVFFDRDIETSFEWQRFGIDSSIIRIIWRIPSGTLGTFRIRHQGYAKDFFGMKTRYEGVSSQFEVIRTGLSSI